MIYRRYNFTIIELLVSIAIIAILSAILLPSFNESRDRARFVRWLQFNKQCSTDPACVINLNFQEGEGGILDNSAKGHDAEGFNANDYNGIMQGDYEWASGRWRKGKKAIQFDGASTYIEITNTQHVDFDNSSSFTVIIWMKFDRLDKWDGIFGKCYMRNAVNGYPQYALYYDGSQNGNSKKSSSGEFTTDIGETSIDFANTDESGKKVVTLDPLNWFQLTLRAKATNEGQNIDLFFNGIKLKSDHTISKNNLKHKDEARLAIGCIRWLLIKNNVPDCNGKPSNFFKGRIDEFLMYNRALSDNEITAHYTMGYIHYN